jgi:hypothetical protein
LLIAVAPERRVLPGSSRGVSFQEWFEFVPRLTGAQPAVSFRGAPRCAVALRLGGHRGTQQRALHLDEQPLGKVRAAGAQVQQCEGDLPLRLLHRIRDGARVKGHDAAPCNSARRTAR